MQKYLFLPAPRQIVWQEGALSLTPGKLIQLDAADPQTLRFAATRLRERLRERFDIEWQISAGRGLPATEVACTLTVLPQAVPQPEGYRLRITPTGIAIHAHDTAGAFYAICTLEQLLAQTNEPALPAVEIHDGPDFPARGVMLDISRDKVPTMATLFALIDRLASWKINQLQLYTEHTFTYRQHPLVWAEASPLTGEELLALDAYCRERCIELVPNQNSFGHMERWLKHAPYAPLAETHGEFETPWGMKMKGPFSLAPEHPGSIALLRELYDELLPHFSSEQFNVGCDETIDLGSGASAEACRARGVGRVYLDFLLKVYREVRARGHRMQFWGDILIHYPDLVPELPRDVIALEWGYEANAPFDAHGAQLAAAGVPFYVCPGTSSWCSLAGRTDNALANLLSAAENGLKHGACGYLNTDWGDRGHWQMLPVSYLGLAMGAAYSWCLASNRDADVPAVVSRFAFDDPSGAMGRVAYDMGNLYQKPGLPIVNGSPLFWALQWLEDPFSLYSQNLSPEAIHATLDAIEAAIAPLEHAAMQRGDAELLAREYRFTARLLRHACGRILMAQQSDPMQQAAAKATLAAELETLIEEYRGLWLARNRPGGLKDSVARFEELLATYRA
ncbi:MAG TPA: glycoside hydrolase family 20 zincin-like fold domain-containing protein [Anaerolineae bacterium]|nr:glycoside hydrolase family 20 zincin-like fold domain-containing protein [Anaerolineae bacterium]